MNKEAEIIIAEVIKSVEDTKGSGAEKKAAANATIVDIIDGIIPLGKFIPDCYEEKGLEFCEDKALIGLKAIAHKIGDCIETVFKKLFHKK